LAHWPWWRQAEDGWLGDDSCVFYGRQYEFSLIKDDAFRTFLRSDFPPILAAKFDSFPKVLVEKHGQPTTTTPSGSGSGSATPQDITVEAEPEAQSTQAKKPVVEEKKSVVGGTSSVEVESRLAASAEDMWLFLTDEKRVPMWTRSPAKVSRPAWFSFSSFSVWAYRLIRFFMSLCPS
jgi:activator of HSP90 ATPase